jgi:hydroxymethylglutaryl-CoA reductase
VLAAVSNAARLFREGGGFTTSSDEPVMIGQIQLMDLPDLYVAAGAIMAQKARLLDEANQGGGSIVRSGGGARDIQVRPLPQTGVGAMLIVHVLYDTRDAMGANAVNTAVEMLAPQLEQITGGRAGLRILSNLTDQRRARAEGKIPAAALATDSLDGAQVVRAIVEAGAFAEADPYRAATHNKGIMNGIDAVIIATGNDWRAVEAGAHAYAARDGRYTSLSRWWQDEAGDLRGSIELPLAVGIVGGATRVHPAAQVALKIMNITSARQLAEIAAAVGLAQNLAAIRALATEGIQRGHMRMHARQIAVAAGANGAMVARVVQQMIDENNIRPERARAIVKELQDG